MFSDMGNEYRGSVCGETRWNIPTTSTFGFSPFFTASSSDLETFGSWDMKGNLLQCADDDAHYSSLQDVPGGYLMDSNLLMNSAAAAATITEDWTQAIMFNSGGGGAGGGGERNSQSQILQEQMNSRLTHGFHGGDSQDPSLKPFDLSTPSSFFLDQIHTPYGFSQQQQQQQPIYENPQLTMAYAAAAGAASTANFSTSSLSGTHDHQVLSPPNSLTDDHQLSNSPFSPSIFSGQAPPMWNTSTHFFPSSTPASLIASSDNLEASTSMTKSKKKNYNGEQPLSKRPRIETPSPLPTFKVRKEKMGDRITALQQLVSPFGKTDTASVLHEAIDYIKFLHDQVNALSNPYLKNGNPMIQHQQMNENIMKKAAAAAAAAAKKVDLKSRGLCLVPISSTFPVASETTADFWTPTTFGGAFSR